MREKKIPNSLKKWNTKQGMRKKDILKHQCKLEKNPLINELYTSLFVTQLKGSL